MVVPIGFPFQYIAIYSRLCVVMTTCNDTTEKFHPEASICWCFPAKSYPYSCHLAAACVSALLEQNILTDCVYCFLGLHTFESICRLSQSREGLWNFAILEFFATPPKRKLVDHECRSEKWLRQANLQRESTSCATRRCKDNDPHLCAPILCSKGLCRCSILPTVLKWPRWVLPMLWPRQVKPKRCPIVTLHTLCDLKESVGLWDRDHDSSNHSCSGDLFVFWCEL